MGYQYKGQAKRNALTLFGLDHTVMESPEQRTEFIQAFRLSDHPKIRRLCLLAEQWPEKSIVRLMEQWDVALDIHTLTEEYRRIQRAHGLIAMSPHIPALMEQAARLGLEHDEQCPACHGRKQQKIIKKGKEVSTPCSECGGTGVRKVHDKDSMRLAAELYGLIGSKGSQVNVNLDLRKVEEHESMADLSATVAPILEGQAKVRDE